MCPQILVGGTLLMSSGFKAVLAEMFEKGCGKLPSATNAVVRVSKSELARVPEG